MSNTLVSLAEAASFLGVSKATLRNWDKAGKLTAVRHPLNDYRMYDLEELRRLQHQVALFGPPGPPPERSVGLDLRGFRRLIARLHAILRDADSQSNIITRFDELTKLLFAKVVADRTAAPGGATSADAADFRRYYAELAAARPHLIPARFAAFGCSDAALRQGFEALRAVDLSATEFDVQGLAFEEVIRHTFDKGDHQQFFTPPQIVEYMVDLVAPFLHGRVCDPASGTGGFLSSIARRRLDYTSLTGVEIDERLSWVTGVNLALHDARDVRTVFLPNHGTLGVEARGRLGRFDVVITNPPFGSDLTDRASLDALALGRNRASRRRGILFVERCLDLLDDGGVLAMVIDEGVLNLPHAEDVRELLLANAELLSVTSLPETAFMPYANVNTAIVVARKRAGVPSSSVFFASADNVGRKPNGDDDILFDAEGRPHVHSDLPAAVAAWNQVASGKPVEPTEALYVADVTANLASEAGSRRIDFQFHHPSRRRARSLIDACTFPVRPLSDICEERNTTLIPSQELADTFIGYTGLAHIEAHTGVAQQVPTAANAIRSAVKQYERGDILFAKMRPNLRKVSLVDFADSGFASPECTVLIPRVDEGGAFVVDPLVLAVLLRSDFVYGQIMHLVAGIGRPRIGGKELRRVLIPVPPPEVQQEVREVYRRRREAARAIALEADTLRQRAAQLEQDAVAGLAAGVALGAP